MKTQVKKRRLFVGVSLTPEQASKLTRVVANLNPSSARISKAENLHLTVFFLGYVAEGEIDQIKKRLKALTKDTRAFSLRFQEIIFAPKTAIKRMIWTVFETNDDFRQLTQDVFEELKSFTKEGYRDNPITHVTLARFNHKDRPDGQLLNLPKSVADIKVDSLTLFESQPTRISSHYTPIANFKLKGSL